MIPPVGKVPLLPLQGMIDSSDMNLVLEKR